MLLLTYAFQIALVHLALVCLLSRTFLLPAFVMSCRQRIPACTFTRLRFCICFRLRMLPLAYTLTHIYLRIAFRTYAKLIVGLDLGLELRLWFQ